jgi:hypothetical protein
MREALVADTASKPAALMRPYVERRTISCTCSKAKTRRCRSRDRALCRSGFQLSRSAAAWREVDDATNERCITLLGSEVIPRVKTVVGPPS